MKAESVLPLLASLGLAATFLVIACHKPAGTFSAVTIEHQITPQPVKVGPAIITLRLADATGNPMTGARITLEGNMSHAGMSPVFGEAKEAEPGRYQAPLEFTMPGDWIILIHITAAGGQKLERQFDVKGVRAN